jgi:hypothetical protein
MKSLGNGWKSAKHARNRVKYEEINNEWQSNQARIAAAQKNAELDRGLLNSQMGILAEMGNAEVTWLAVSSPSVSLYEYQPVSSYTQTNAPTVKPTLLQRIKKWIAQ